MSDHSIRWPLEVKIRENSALTVVWTANMNERSGSGGLDERPNRLRVGDTGPAGRDRRSRPQEEPQDPRLHGTRPGAGIPGSAAAPALRRDGPARHHAHAVLPGFPELPG